MLPNTIVGADPQTRTPSITSTRFCNFLYRNHVVRSTMTYLEERWEKLKKYDRQVAGSRTVADEFGFRLLAVLTILTYVLFFLVAIAKITQSEPATYGSETIDIAQIIRVREAQQETAVPSWYWIWFVEHAAAFLHIIFHHHWFGFFRHYEHTENMEQIPLASLSEERPNEVIVNVNANSEELWYVGVLIALFGTIVSALGNHLVTLSHRLSLIEMRERDGILRVGGWEILESLVPSNRRIRTQVMIALCKPSTLVWLFGNVAITIIGTVLTLTSLAYASQALLAPLSGLTIVWNALLATTRWFGGTRLTRQDMLGTWLTLMGCVVIVISGPRNTKHFTLEDLLSNFTRFIFQLYVVVAGTVIVVLHQIARSSSFSTNVKRFAYGILPGLMGGFSNVLAKAAVELVSQRMLLSSAGSALILVCTVVAATSQLSWINTALQIYEPLFIVPIYQATLLLSSTLSGALYYGDFQNLTMYQYSLFILGVGLIVLGVTVLSSAGPQQQPQNGTDVEWQNVGVQKHGRTRRRHSSDPV